MPAWVVSSNEKTAASLAALVKTEATGSVHSAVSGADARRRMLQSSWDIVIVDSPLSDEAGHLLCTDLAAKGEGSIVLIAKAEAAEELAARLEDVGVLVLPKPISRAQLTATLHLMRVAQHRAKALLAENQKLQKRLEETRVVGRAKCALIQFRGYTEPEAHHFIEHEAMDSRISKKQVAEEILRNFGDQM